MQTILDPCCGGRMFYFDKNHKNILYLDKRGEIVKMKDRGNIRTLKIEPDYLSDFTSLNFSDNTFYFVVFDPPHYINIGKNSWLATVDMDIEFRINTEYDALWCHFSSTKQKGVLDAVYHYSCTPLGDRE